MSTQKCLTVKYLVVGDSGVGKTSLLVRYCQDTFQSQYLTTIGVDFKIKRIELDGNQVTLNIWDTAGQQRFRNITKSFYKGAHGIVLTYSITDPVSFNHIESWVEQIKQTGKADIDMILIAAKADLETDRKVSHKQGLALAERYGIQFLETSARDNSNIEKIFELLTRVVVARIGIEEKEKQNVTTALTNIKQKEKKSKKDECC